MDDIKKILDLFREAEPQTEEVYEDGINLYDSFDFEIGEDLIIETGVVGITDEGDIIVEGDDVMLGILSINTLITEAEDIAEKMKMGASTDAAASGTIGEAEYQGRKVPLGKPMKGDVKKSKVYVRKPDGKVVKVNFGDKNMRIKKSNPDRRKSFRARHNCDNPGPRWKARYWSCRAW
jgi:hypothetical protein